MLEFSAKFKLLSNLVKTQKISSNNNITKKNQKFNSKVKKTFFKMNLRNGKSLSPLRRPFALKNEDQEEQQSKKRKSQEEDITDLEPVKKIARVELDEAKAIKEEKVEVEPAQVGPLFFVLGKQFSIDGLWNFPQIIKKITSYLDFAVSLHFLSITLKRPIFLSLYLHIYFIFAGY